jgi:hypothetical protein
VQQKILLIGLPLAVVCIWLMVTWEPVSRQTQDSPASEPMPAAEAPPPPPTAAAQPPAAPVAPATNAAPVRQLDEPPMQPETEISAGDEPSSMKLEMIPDQKIDPQNLPAPRKSGPIVELQQQFESGARDSSSSALESTVESAFKIPTVPEGLFDSVVCHAEVCRIRARWTPQRASGFLFAITELATKSADAEGKTPMFARNYGFGEPSERNSNGEQVLEVYVRKQGDAPQ